MENRIDAIYARQSVDRKDSISIESQIEFCKYELRGGNFKDLVKARAAKAAKRAARLAEAARQEELARVADRKSVV